MAVFANDESVHNKFSGFVGVIPENMIISIAMFASEQEAAEYAAERYGDKAEIRKYPASFEFYEALRRH